MLLWTARHSTRQALGFRHFTVWAEDRWNTPAQTIERYLQSHSSKHVRNDRFTSIPSVPRQMCWISLLQTVTDDPFRIYKVWTVLPEY